MPSPVGLRLRTAAAVVLAAMVVAAPAAAQSPSAPPAAPAHFSYEGEDGPAHWAELDPSYATCADGSAQSPIDITNPTPADLVDPVFAYTTGEVNVVNNGHSVQANAAPGSSVTVDGVEYPLAQVHFHAPSEHRINGLLAPVEAHFVNKTADGQITVVGVMIIQGDQPNAAWAPYVNSLGIAEGADQTTQFDWGAMLPASTLSVRYAGSLTTPPCSEGVHWLILTEPVQLSADQIEAFAAAHTGNDRPLQPLNGRPVQVDDTGS